MQQIFWWAKYLSRVCICIYVMCTRLLQLNFVLEKKTNRKSKRGLWNWKWSVWNSECAIFPFFRIPALNKRGKSIVMCQNPTKFHNSSHIIEAKYVKMVGCSDAMGYSFSLFASLHFYRMKAEPASAFIFYLDCISLYTIQ